MSIEASICGWRVPPNWRKEVLAPIKDAAFNLERIPRPPKRSALTSENEVDEAALAEAVKGKLQINPKCPVKAFDVYVPWNESMVVAHNEESAHT